MGAKVVEFKYGELFSGPGGLALGAMRSSVQKNGLNYRMSHAWSVDYEKDSCETFRRNIASGNPGSVFCQDVRTLDI